MAKLDTYPIKTIPETGDLLIGSDMTTTQNETKNFKLTEIVKIAHTHLESDVTDLDKYTQAQVDALITNVTLTDTDDLSEGIINLYFTDARVSANASVLANTNARHSHLNKTLLDTITDTGVGDKYLADDGLYKTVSSGSGGDMTKAVYDPLLIELDIYDITNSHIPAGATEGMVAHLNASTSGVSWAIDKLTTRDINFTDTVGSPTIAQLSDYFDVVESAGVYILPIITDNLDGTINIGGTEGIIAENPPTGLLYGILNAFKYLGQSNVTMLEGINYVYLDWNNGNITAKTSNTLVNVNGYSEITIALIYRTANVLDISDVGFTNERGLNRVHRKDIAVYAVEHGSGIMIAELPTLGFTITSGELWFGLIQTDISSYSTATTNFTYWWRDGVGGWNSTQSNTISNTLFDDNNGTLSTLSNNNYSVTFIYITPTGNVHVVYSQVNIRQYQDVKPPTDVPDIVNKYTILIGEIVVEKSATTYTLIRSRFDSTFSAGIVTVHAELSGLDADDHIQYLTDTRFDTRFGLKSTTDLTEGTNLYYTDIRFDTRFGLKSTTDLTEGTNLYYTDTRFDTRFDTQFTLKSTTDLSEGTNLYYTDARFDTRFNTKNSDNLTEGSTNLYYTTARADLKRDKSVSILSKTANYTLLSTDADKIIECSGTFTLILPTLAIGFNFTMVNVGTGTITISGNINGGTSNTIVNSTQYTAISVYYNSTTAQIGIGNID